MTPCPGRDGGRGSLEQRQVRGRSHRTLNRQPVVTEDQNHLGSDGEWLSPSGQIWWWSAQLIQKDMANEVYIYIYIYIDIHIYTLFIYTNMQIYIYIYIYIDRSVFEKCCCIFASQHTDWRTGTDSPGPWTGGRWSSSPAVGHGLRYLQRQGGGLCDPGDGGFRRWLFGVDLMGYHGYIEWHRVYGINNGCVVLCICSIELW